MSLSIAPVWLSAGLIDVYGDLPHDDRGNMHSFKTPATILGMGALIAMGVIGVAAGGAPDAGPALLSGGMTTGATTTLTNSGTIAPVVNVPPVKATFFGEG